MPVWIFDNFLPLHLHDGMYSYCQKSLYSPDHSSSLNSELLHPRLVSKLTQDQIISLPLTEVFKTTAAELGYNLNIERAYINLCSKDTVCTSHVDGQEVGLTMIYYPNTKWDIDWGGDTMFFNADKEIAFASLCKPNRALFFDQRILHTARPPTHLAPVFRYTVAYKSLSKHE